VRIVLLVCTLAAAVNNGECAPICMLDILGITEPVKKFCGKSWSINHALLLLYDQFITYNIVGLTVI